MLGASEHAVEPCAGHSHVEDIQQGPPDVNLDGHSVAGLEEPEFPQMTRLHFCRSANSSKIKFCFRDTSVSVTSRTALIHYS